MGVSVVIPVFNGATYIAQTIESVLNQRGTHIELIIVDDGSTDETPAVVRRFSNNLTYHRLGQRKGPSVARNAGLSLARHNYIQFLDSDDIVLEGSLRRKETVLRELDVDLIITGWQSLDEIESGVFECGAVTNNSWIDFASDPATALIGEYWNPPAAWMMNRSGCLSSIRFNETVEFAEDVRFLIDCANSGARFSHLPETLALYRRTIAPSYSRQSNIKFASCVARNALDMDFLWRRQGMLNAERKKALVDVYDYTARILYDHQPKLFQQVVVHLLSLRKTYTTWPAIVGRLSPLVGHVQAGKMADYLQRVKQFSLSKAA